MTHWPLIVDTLEDRRRFWWITYNYWDKLITYLISNKLLPLTWIHLQLVQKLVDLNLKFEAQYYLSTDGMSMSDHVISVDRLGKNPTIDYSVTML